jgi:hypothetical protein
MVYLHRVGVGEKAMAYGAVSALFGVKLVDDAPGNGHIPHIP